MALEKTFRALCVSVRRLSDRIAELRLTVVEDRPQKNDASLVDNFEYAVEDMGGWVRDMLQNSKTAQQAVAHPLDLDRARRELSACQDYLKRVQRAFFQDLVCWERINELTLFGNERGGEWKGWVLTLRRGAEHCRQPLEEISAALAACWEELAERIGMTSVTVQTNIAPAAVHQMSEEFVED